MERLYLSKLLLIDYIRKIKPLLLSQLHPLIVDTVLAFELEKLGMNFIDKWDNLDSDEFKNISDLVQSLSI